MKSTLEEAHLRAAFNSSFPSGVTLASFYMDMPESNGQLHFCAFRNRRWNQLTAMTLPVMGPWDYSNPPHPKGDVILPDRVVYSIQQTLRYFGIVHIIGVLAESKVEEGKLLTVPLFGSQDQPGRLHG